MKKLPVLIFLVGAICGGGVTAAFLHHLCVEHTEVKVLTKTEYKEMPNTTVIQYDALEVPKDHQDGLDSNHENDEVGKFDSPAENDNESVSQLEKFERSMASEQEATTTPTEEMLGEEVHPDSNGESPLEEPQ